MHLLFSDSGGFWPVRMCGESSGWTFVYRVINRSLSELVT